MKITQKDIETGFGQLGLNIGDYVLVHSSLSSFGYVEGGAYAVITALLNTVGEEGLAIVPTLTGKPTDSKEMPPVFDVTSTPCWTGKIPETFRLMPEAKRSLHPTHSVASIGSSKGELLEGHETGHSPCDSKSPYYKNAIWEGYIMLLGVDQESNTTIHCCEELADVPYHLQKDVAEIYMTGYQNQRILVRNRLHDWKKPPTDFNKFDELFLEHGIMKIGVIGNSVIRLIHAGRMLEFAVDKLRKEPLFLLTNKENR